MGLEPKIFDGTSTGTGLQRMNSYSLIRTPANPDSFNQFSSLSARPNRRRNRRLFRRRSQRGLGARSRHHEIGNSRHDFGPEARSVEHAVMSDAFLHVMHA